MTNSRELVAVVSWKRAMPILFTFCSCTTKFACVFNVCVLLLDSFIKVVVRCSYVFMSIVESYLD